MKQSFDHKNLTQWFLANQRDLPWRNNRSPYAVWVSEMMLQQTQVAVVIPYFERWMQRFPSLPHLADATLDEVIKTWEGLGYYSRARYLHAGAKYIMDEHHGIFPENLDHLQKIKGLGPYTVGAILSFAFNKRASAVDGNVMRVLARYFHIEEEITKTTTQKAMRALALSILPEKEPWIFNEALIELGATICTRQPQCMKCPVKFTCKSLQKGDADRLPLKSVRAETEALYRAVAVIQWQGYFLVRRGQQGEVMSDLYEFPYFPSTKEGMETDQLLQHVHQLLGCKTQLIASLSDVTHSFTRYKVFLKSTHLICQQKQRPTLKSPYEWFSTAQLHTFAFSSGHKRVLQQIVK